MQGDERRIRQVVFNLLSNAVKFTPQGGRVYVSTASDNGQVRIAVRDTGPGIADNDRERIFKEFQQARDTNGERPESTGRFSKCFRSLDGQIGFVSAIARKVDSPSPYGVERPHGSATSR